MNQDKILSNLESFTAFNSRKTERFYALLPAGHIRRVLSSMLFFIHTNQPRLPGYINEITPHGIHGYEIDDDTRRYLKGVYPTINFNPSNEKPFVQMVAVIGSAGTIAYNKKSDFDFWICVDRSSVSEKKMTLFRSKIEKIQEWAESQSGTEIHLFINDIADLRRNLFDEDEEEAFGSTLGALLKDEFYRSSIILAGKVPFWWVVPVQTDNATYDRLFSEIDPGIRDDSFIDIGNLHHIRKDDFIGAALFQIVKSLGNPFKSILKLGVLEKYLFEDDSVHLISQQLKARVQERKFTNTILDSYLLMFANVYQYYKKSGMEKSSLSILKINLYLKIGPNLSKYSSLDNRKLPYKVEQMYRYVKHWNWNRQFVQELDSFDNWDFPKVTKFWDQVKKFMLLSYQKISREFTHFDLQSKISKSDYTLLSRKIRGYFSTNPDKIEKYISFKETPGEPYLILTEQKDSEGGYFWKLHKKSSETKESSSCVMLKQARHILPLLSWAAINGVYEKSLTRITMNYQEGNIDTETIELLNLMVDIFTGRDLKTKNSYFLREAFAIRNLIVIHYGNRLASSQEYVDYLFHTSWSEDYHKSYDTYDSLLDILPRITQGGVITGQPFDTVCRFYAPDSMQKLLRDYYRVFKRCYDHIVHSESRNKRFITKLNNSYLIVTCKGDSVEASHYTSATNFTSALSVSPVDNVEYAVSPGDDPLLLRIEYILKNAPQDCISTFYDIFGKFIFIYTLNENRNLFVSVKPVSQRRQLVSAMYHFCHCVIEDLKKTNPFSYLEKNSVGMYKITQDPRGTISHTEADNTDLMGFNHSDGLRLTYRPDNTYSLRYGPSAQSEFMPLADTVGNLAAFVKQNIALFKKHGGLCFHSIMLRSFRQSSNLTTNIYFRERSKIELYFDRMLTPRH